MANLLKILTGPQEGAELELQAGTPVRIGSGDDCDVILVDAMAPAVALEIIADSDTFIVKALAPQIFAGNVPMKTDIQATFPAYTVFTCGSTRLTIGNDDKPWPPLSWAPLEQLLEKRQMTLQEELEEKKRKEAEEAAEKERLAEEERLKKEAEEAEQKRQEELKRLEEYKALRRRRTQRLLCIASWMVLILLFLGGSALAARKAWLISKPPQEDTPDNIELSLQKLKMSSLETLIKKFGLTLSERKDMSGRVLTGNLPNAAIRLHIERLLKNKYFGITHQLTDDQTLAEAVRELLWGATNGCVRLVSLKDRNALVSGMTASKKEWDTICANIKADVPRLNKLNAKVVFADVMSAKLIKAFKSAGFTIRTETLPLEIQLLGNVPEKHQKAFETMLKEAEKFFPPEAKLKNLVKWVPDAPASAPVIARKKASAPRLPIASIRMDPVPCIVMLDGSRYGKGAMLGEVTITEITLDSVTVRKDSKSYTFKP